MTPLIAVLFRDPNKTGMFHFSTLCQLTSRRVLRNSANVNPQNVKIMRRRTSRGETRVRWLQLAERFRIGVRRGLPLADEIEIFPEGARGTSCIMPWLSIGIRSKIGTKERFRRRHTWTEGWSATQVQETPIGSLQNNERPLYN
jgi:hypothetical protein